MRYPLNIALAAVVYAAPKLLCFLLVVGCLTVATPSAAQDKLDVYADRERTTCSLTEPVYPPVAVIYLFLTGPAASTGVRFSVPKPDCWVGASYIGEETPYVSIGKSYSDWTIAFGQCLTPPVYLGNVSFIVSGQSLPCCEVKAVQPALGFPFVYTDCNFAENPLTAGQSVFVNADASCPCMPPVATEPTTWGRVKSLYR